MHHHKTGEWNSEVVAQSFLAHLGSEMQGIAFAEFLIGDLCQAVAGVEYFEKQFVAFLTIFAHERLQGFHRRCLNLLEAIEGIHVADGVEDIVALRHLNG